jgi:carbonic anhydrase
MKRIMVIAAVAISLAGCSTAGEETGEHDVGTDGHWGYSGALGPQHWADLDPAFSACRSGREQSPIDLSGAVLVEKPTVEQELGRAVLSVSQRARVMDVLNNGHTIQVINDIPMTVELDGAAFELVQYHFHAPSEHTIDGKHSPLEVHFVHQSADNELAVLGVLVEEGAYDPLWDPVIQALPGRPGDTRHLDDLNLDPKEFGPLPRVYYRYMGSLTTPPCTEGVHWVVMATKRQISTEQMAEVLSHLHDNNRPVQPLGERMLTLVTEEGETRQPESVD